MTMVSHAFVVLSILVVGHGSLAHPAAESITVESVTAPSGSTPRYSVATWQLKVSGITNVAITHGSVWEAVNVTLVLQPPSGSTPVEVRGYRQNDNEWRVRFAPSIVGSYTYSLKVDRFGEELHSSAGSLQCSPSSAKGWLRPQYGKYPYRSAYEGDGSLFTGSGIGDCLNTDLTFLTLNETSGEQYNRSLEEYVSDYSDFSIFRWSNGNCAYDIVSSFDGNIGRPFGNQYDEKLSEVTDNLIDTLRQHGFSIWFVPFTKHVKLPVFPYAGNKWSPTHEAQREALYRYLDYVVARWGAQVDIWSLTNEQRDPDSWINVTSDYLHKIDPYKRPVSVSWQRPDLAAIDVTSVHWYWSQETEKEDVDACKAIDDALGGNKPVYFTESGNRAHNWDRDSHTRMRIRTWTAFFKGAVLMWWNTAGTRDCHPCGGGNMFLGRMERKYQSVYRQFAEQMTDPAVQQFNLTVPEGVRAYGLRGFTSSGTILMIYLHHFASHNETTAVKIELPSSGFPSLSSCTNEWVHPDNGTSVVGSASSDTAVLSPPFMIDIAVKVVCPKRSADASTLLV